MKISELIEELEKIRGEYGDIPVRYERQLSSNTACFAGWQYEDPKLEYQRETLYITGESS